jgi:hypothetical protein
MIKTGPKKGSICGRKVKADGKCGWHYRDKEQPIVTRVENRVPPLAKIDSPPPEPVSLPVEDCPVCMEQLCSRDLPFDYYKSNLCNHRIHKDCIIKSGHLKCPICRKDVTTAFDACDRASCNLYFAKYDRQEREEYRNQLINEQSQEILDFLTQAMRQAMEWDDENPPQLTIRFFTG